MHGVGLVASNDGCAEQGETGERVELDRGEDCVGAGLIGETCQ